MFARIPDKPTPLAYNEASGCLEGWITKLGRASSFFGRESWKRRYARLDPGKCPLEAGGFAGFRCVLLSFPARG